MQAELAGIASYPYDGSRLLLPAGYGVLPSIHDQLRDIICNSASESSLSLASQPALSVRSKALSHCAQRRNATIRGPRHFLGQGPSPLI